MAEKILKSPGYLDREIDESRPLPTPPLGTSVGVVGTAEKGPAFVPVVVNSLSKFEAVFGKSDAKRQAWYAAEKALGLRPPLSYVRVLGSGANSVGDDFLTTQTDGTAKNAGFRLDTTDCGHLYFISHTGGALNAAAEKSYRVLKDSSVVEDSVPVTLIAAVLMTDVDTNAYITTFDSSDYLSTVVSSEEVSALVVEGNTPRKFKLVFATGSDYTSFIVSLDPDRDDYIAKVLNTNPLNFSTAHHYLYADFPMELSLFDPPGTDGDYTDNDQIKLLRGDSTWLERFGRFDARYNTPASPWFISQPYGSTEYDLFQVESIDDGAYAAGKYKVSISDLKRSSDKSYPYSSFTVELRDFDDDDGSPVILEAFKDVNLDPDSPNYIARAIGDRKQYFNFDATEESERKVVTLGNFPNNSDRVRVVVSNDVKEKKVPADVMPFGFRGPELFKAAEKSGADEWHGTASPDARLDLAYNPGTQIPAQMPALPFVQKVTLGSVPLTLAATDYLGKPSQFETASSKIYWGTKFNYTTDINNPNYKLGKRNRAIKSMTKFLGIKKLDTALSGRDADSFHWNKFTLARVAFPKTLEVDGSFSVKGDVDKIAAGMWYVRNGTPNASESYTLWDNHWSFGSYHPKRITFATLVHDDSAIDFNRFSPYAKFTVPMFGGWDGLNIFDQEAYYMTDRAASDVEEDADGNAAGANDTYTSPGFDLNTAGAGLDNATVVAYRTAVNIITDPINSDVDIVLVPGIRDPLITDYMMEKAKEHNYCIYVMDAPVYDADGKRIFDFSSVKPNVRQTLELFDGRDLDNNATISYLFNPTITDSRTGRNIKVAPSVAGVAGILTSEINSDPWFAPAGFNRGTLGFVSNVDVRLKTEDKDLMETVRINPIASLPDEANPKRKAFVLFGQQTLEGNSLSAFTRVNVKRMEIAVKRYVRAISSEFVFEKNNAKTRDAYKAKLLPYLSIVKARFGIEDFQVIVDESNNTVEDVENYRMNVAIYLVPVRAIEKVTIDFVVRNNGTVSFN